MAKSVTKLQTLVAYPDDVAEERAILDDVVKELNTSSSETLGREIHLIDWKTHVAPDFGTDAQAVINQQLGEDYDIFLGIMWLRFGEPTPRAQSGTAEEFNRALQRWRRDPQRLRIMFYFKDAPPRSLKELDPYQLTLVREFKAEVDREGGLYKEFKGPQEFATYVRLHLGRQLREWGTSWGVTSGVSVLSSPRGEPATEKVTYEIEEPDEGFLDLVERSKDGFDTLAEILSGMNTELGSFTKRIQDKTRELSEANETNADIKQRKRVVNSTSEIMDQHSAFLEQELPRYSSTFSIAIDSMARALSIWQEDKMEGRAEAEEAHQALKQVKSGLRSFYQSMVEFQSVVAGLPRLTSTFNRSKRRMTLALAGLLTEIQRQIDLSEEADAQIRRIFGSSDDENDLEEQVWVNATSHNPAFDSLRDSSEDVYTLADGIPFNGQG